LTLKSLLLDDIDLCRRFGYGYLDDRTTVPSQSSGMLLLRSPFKAFSEWLVAA